MLFSILKWLHILAAMAAVASNATLAHTLKGIKSIDDRLANPASTGA